MAERTARIVPANVSMLPTVLDTADVSNVTRMSQYQVRKFVRSGDLRPLRYSSHRLLFHDEEVLRFLREMTWWPDEGADEEEGLS